MTDHRLEVDVDLCSAYGACVEEAPDSVALDPDGYAYSTAASPNLEQLQQAVDACPMAALRIIRDAQRRAAS
jgi:ferredoxin